MANKENKTDIKIIIPCFMCRQPVVEDNRFTVSWSEEGEEKSRILCGSRCLRDWADNYSENIKLDLYDIQ
jgi:hypothetical protein